MEEETITVVDWAKAYLVTFIIVVLLLIGFVFAKPYYDYKTYQLQEAAKLQAIKNQAIQDKANIKTLGVTFEEYLKYKEVND